MEPVRSPFPYARAIPPHSWPLSFPPLAGLSFVKLDNLVPSLRAITLDYFCLQSCAPPYTCSLEMIGVELEKENNAWGRAGRARKRHETKGDIATRRGRKGSLRDRTIERPFPLDCREREPKGDFVRMLAQIQIGELGVENDSAKESSIGEPTAPENDALDPRIAGGIRGV